MKLRHYYIPFCALFLTFAAFLAACSSKQSEATLTVSVEPQRALLEAIVGDRFKVITLLTSGANPETFEPTVKARMAVDNSAIFFKVGNMPFEDTIERSLAESVTVVDCSTGITPIYGTHSHDGDADDHAHSNIDPHIWVSLKNARIIARTMLNAVIKIDSNSANTYRQNFAALDRRLAEADSTFSARLAADSERTFAVWHPSLSYFARDYGLQQIAVGFENKDMSPKHLVEVTKLAKDAGVKVFFFQKEYDSRQAQTLNTELGTRMVTINPLAYDFQNELSNIVNELTHK
jgi:zinc transport system substrate-binding protein